MSQSPLGKPLTLKCGLVLPNRLAKAAMAEGMAPDGLPNEKLNSLYGKWADGGWGMIITANVQVDARHLGSPGDLAVDEAVNREKMLKAWKTWAETTQRNGNPAIVQINHPGRQSPVGAGKRGFFEKTLAPSAVPLKVGTGLIMAAINKLVFGTPKEMTTDDIRHVVHRFTESARLAADAGFAGVELHAAHGYLLAQFLSEKSNKRTDAYGGSPAARAKFVVDIIHAVRNVVPKGFCVGIKLNSVDHQSAAELAGCIEQLKLIAAAGVDFIEVSGGSYEDPLMVRGPAGKQNAEPAQKSDRTKAREAFFLEFAKAIRHEFSDMPLMVTGGFRTRLGMENALAEGDCDLIGIGRPAVLNPEAPYNTILNAEVAEGNAKLYTKTIQVPWLLKLLGLNMVGIGAETMWYSKQIQKMAEA
ncbi:NADH:flavin oxidoreductase/NADH oxidase [Sodiomyces alkalinus F11]|uniref:NADH:flavin oxidoreductase/NADH oxidase n=1 Tax=Sodiomyces alkalinus (strain CBS 110278 / VKM F-3762 / F11) TaxID=1314773 RepID=A0A3N2Q1J9_SODAK|nr:NADH:flavin oxidoreductase/NADH oxidase [Sodiomyces alkalinus F11]ROT40634.1 NADH:flavin oxidoreductase/NADH oxidase [Sodiomyces alkalinus F11]